MFIILALRRLRQKDHEFEASLAYIVKSCLKKERRKERMGVKKEGKTKKRLGILKIFFQIL
jgi:hypothetical protein